MAVRHSLKLVAVETVKAFYHIAFGDRVVARVDALSLLTLISLAAMVFLAVRAWKTEPAATIPRHLPAAAFWIAVLFAAYTGGIVLVALRSIVADFFRYYLPVYPVILVSVAAFSLSRTRPQYLAATVVVAAILAIQGRSMLAPVPVAAVSDKMRTMLEQETAPGVPIGQWLQKNTRPGDSIVAVNGQMLHHFVQRPVISVIEPIYSNRAFDQDAFQGLMRERHSRFLVVMPDASPSDVPEQEAIPFLHNLATGTVPSWLTPAARTPSLAVFECLSCSATLPNGRP